MRGRGRGRGGRRGEGRRRGNGGGKGEGRQCFMPLPQLAEEELRMSTVGLDL